MAEENINLIRAEFDNDRKRWTDVVFQRIFYYGDLKLRLAEREFQFVLFLTTISVAFIALVLPIVTVHYTNVAIFAFLISSALGFLRIILSIVFDKKEISKDEGVELDFFKKCQNLSTDIYNDSLDKIVVSEKIKTYMGLGNEAINLAKGREKEKYTVRLILSIIYYSFLFFFAFGFIGLSYEITCYLWFIR